MKVVVRAIGPVAAALGGKRIALELPDGANGEELLDRLARERPAVAPFLGAGDRRIAQLFRAGEPLGPGASLAAGDEVSLVVAIAGG